MENPEECETLPDHQKCCTCSYASKVKFAQKLGYNEQLLQTALIRLGPRPTQNELLSELIKLGEQYKNNNAVEPENAFLDFQTNRNLNLFLPDNSRNVDVNGLRPIVIDGSNVAISHGNKEIFSCRGIRICVDWFKKRGHNDITVFVPKWRKESFSTDNIIKDQEILQELERERLLVFTPSRFIGGKRMICYDDRYILKLAAETQGIVVSNDNYRDLVQESSEFKKVVEERLLMFSFVNDIFMPPDDPLGRSGPKLENFLRLQSFGPESTLVCPYGKKCTFGNKCKFFHPKKCSATSDGLSGKQNSSKNLMRVPLPVGKSHSMPLSSNEQSVSKIALHRTQSCSTYNSIQTNTMEKCRSQLPEGLLPSSHHEHRPLNARDFSSRKTINCDNYNSMSPPCTNNNPAITIDESINPHRKLHRKLYSNPLEQSTFLSSKMENANCDNQLHGCFGISNYAPAEYHMKNTRIPSSLGKFTDKQTDPGDQRRNLFYHLSSIFPVEYVESVMEQYPAENEPKNLCALILQLFSNK